MNTEIMKKKLLILTDLWGLRKASFLNRYLDEFEAYFEIRVIDSLELACIDKRVYTKESLHRQFINGGIDRAVERLVLSLEEPVHILAFSIGGVIAWKAAMRSSYVEYLTCVSSTRLRLETERPSCQFSLVFGSNESYGPLVEWFEKMDTHRIEISGGEHDFYRYNKEISVIKEQVLHPVI